MPRHKPNLAACAPIEIDRGAHYFTLATFIKGRAPGGSIHGIRQGSDHCLDRDRYFTFKTIVR
jgi:hypothetical protein